MAYKLIWSPAARDDLHDIVVFIARDNPERAMSFGYELISQTDRLQSLPEFGRVVPEYQNPTDTRDYLPAVPDCLSSES
jgi:plasmid stabilization system protein ParE